MVSVNTLLTTIDTLAVERGERNGDFYSFTITTGELLTIFGLKPSTPHHRHIRGSVVMHYPKTTCEAFGYGDGSSGFTLHIKIRSK